MRPTLLALLLAACTETTLGDDLIDPVCDSVDAAPEGEFLRREAIVSSRRAACSSAMHATAGAIGSTLAIRLEQWDGDAPARLVVTDLLGVSMAEDTARGGDDVHVTLDRSGEVLVVVEPSDPDEPANDYALSVECIAGCDAQYTRYPIVMFHGAGPDQVGLVDYFYGIVEALEGQGYLVVTPAVDPFASTRSRGAQWAAHLDELIAQGVGRKFDVIGHSQGGIDARYVVSDLGYDDRVAAVITVSSPHRGSTVADVSAGLVDTTPFGDDLVDAAMGGIAAAMGLSEQDAMGTLATLNTEAMATFNDENPDVPGVYYASWAGHSCGILELSCIAEQGGEVVTPLLGPTQTLLAMTDGPNDGMVPVESAIWGDYQGEIPADHFDEVGQLVGVTPAVFDHRQFYLREARRLAELGF